MPRTQLNQQCDNCLYWHEPNDETSIRKHYSACLRYPPVYDPGQGSTAYPQTFTTWWCGEHQPLGPKKRVDLRPKERSHVPSRPSPMDH